MQSGSQAILNFHSSVTGIPWDLNNEREKKNRVNWKLKKKKPLAEWKKNSTGFEKLKVM